MPTAYSTAVLYNGSCPWRYVRHLQCFMPMYMEFNCISCSNISHLSFGDDIEQISPCELTNDVRAIVIVNLCSTTHRTIQPHTHTTLKHDMHACLTNGRVKTSTTNTTILYYHRPTTASASEVTSLYPGLAEESACCRCRVHDSHSPDNLHPNGSLFRV